MTRTTWRAALCTALMLTSPAVSHADEPLRTITVLGYGEIAAVPDLASVTIGVETEDETASGALRANTAQMGRLIAVLDTVGITARDRQTSNLSVQPRYRYEDRDGRNETILTGYSAANTLSLRIRDLASMGDVLDALVAAGGNRLNGINFEISESEALLDDARVAALVDARRKATLYAEGAGAVLGDVVTISEVGVAPPPAPPIMMSARAMSSDESVPIEAGERTMSVRITTVWEMAPSTAPD